MLQLLVPSALLALASLAIPAVLHLWRPPAQTVRIGTLRYFTGPAVKRLTKLRWRERLLLLVRLLLLTTLALLLARPFWNNPPPTTPQRWALRSPDVALAGDTLQRWRELTSAGYEMRWLERDFPRVEGADGGPAADPSVADIWSLLREADARLLAGSKIAVFASDRIVSYAGERPIPQRSVVEWIAAPSDGNANQLERLISAELSHDQQQLQCVITSGNPAATRYLRASVPTAPGNNLLPPPAEHLSLETQRNPGGGVSVRLVRSKAAPGPWLTATAEDPLDVLILRGADRTGDARYVEAALRAIVPNASIAVQAFSPAMDLSRAAWLFWLNDEPVPAEVTDDVARRGIDLLSDAPNSTEAVATATSASFNAAGLTVGLLRRVAPRAPSAAAAAVWIDSFGQPVLTTERQGAGRHWRFFSRFHPEWNDLPRSSALPALLASLMLPDEPPPADLRRIDPSQSAPAAVPERRRSGVAAIELPRQPIDLHRLLWLLAAVLFAFERALSLRVRVASVLAR